MSAPELFHRVLTEVRRISRPRAVKLAQTKRDYERELRAAGYSRAQAVKMASERFRNG